jgi:hypothetical protein
MNPATIQNLREKRAFSKRKVGAERRKSLLVAWRRDGKRGKGQGDVEGRACRALATCAVRK